MEATAAAVDFVYIVRERFINQPSKFNEFAKCLSGLSISTGMQDRDFLVSKLKNLFLDNHPDLLLALDDFLPRNMVSEKKDDHNKYSWLLANSPNEFFNKIRDRCIEKNDKEFSVLIKFCELIVSCHEKKITAKEVDMEFRDLFKDDVDIYIECTLFLAELWGKSNKSSGGFSKKRRKVWRPSLYDKTMAVKEFYLHDMGLTLVRIESVIMKLDGDPETFGECFSAHDCRCIRELYKGSDPDYSFGEELLEILRCDPVARIVARGVVQERLREKLMQLKEQKFRLDQVWKEIFEDIREKGAVCRHREMLHQMKESSRTDYYV